MSKIMQKCGQILNIGRSHQKLRGAADAKPGVGAKRGLRLDAAADGGQD
jgi:hypothetical protein